MCDEKNLPTASADDVVVLPLRVQHEAVKLIQRSENIRKWQIISVWLNVGYGMCVSNKN